MGFETLSQANVQTQNKVQNLKWDYNLAVLRLHDLGVMVTVSFMFGMDDDDETIFDRPVGWAISQGIKTATFHNPDPLSGHSPARPHSCPGRITTENWDLYDTRHAVFRPARMTARALEAGY